MMLIRPVEPRDRERVHKIVAAVGNFNSVEVSVAMELVDDFIARQSSSDYRVHVLEDSGDVIGYVCFGLTPLTDNTYDLYWMAVDPEYQGKGHGRRLMRFAEEEVQRLGGRRLVLETSSLESYRKTVRFYEQFGYRLVGRIPNFYRTGDDKLIYIKEFPEKSPS